MCSELGVDILKQVRLSSLLLVVFSCHQHLFSPPSFRHFFFSYTFFSGRQRCGCRHRVGLVFGCPLHLALHFSPPFLPFSILSFSLFLSYSPSPYSRSPFTTPPQTYIHTHTRTHTQRSTDIHPGVVHCFATGAGGGGVMLIYNASTQEVHSYTLAHSHTRTHTRAHMHTHAYLIQPHLRTTQRSAQVSVLDYRETAPAVSTPDMYVVNNWSSTVGPTAAGVPGSLRGLELGMRVNWRIFVRRFCTHSLHSLFSHSFSL